MDQPHAQAFGSRLKERREALGFSTRALAALAEVNQATVVRLEAGRIAEPRPDKLRRLAEALQLPTGETFALAGYARANDLPSLPVYLRAKYPELTAADIERLEDYVTELLGEHLGEQAIISLAGLGSDEVTS